ncbi:hypothetical protein H5410_057390 [Solanum commersonii]|uniref:Uncharacterized protein n=1 Tax=Solanum commersonii TaxID=4109 RepID=A0A9J5WQG2_SOLCO|nr:hypothetical protein H5410_057390 [Solanum commersonii]
MQITGTCCKQCKLQGHAETNCMVLHSELLKPKPIHEGVENLNEVEVTGPQSEWKNKNGNVELSNDKTFTALMDVRTNKEMQLSHTSFFKLYKESRKDHNKAIIFTKNNNRDSTTEENKDKGQEDNVSIEVKESEDLSFDDCNQGLSKEMTKSVGENVEVCCNYKCY